MDKNRPLLIIDLSACTLWLKSHRTNSPQIRDGITVKATTTSARFYLAVIALVADQHRKRGNSECVPITDISEEIDLYSYVHSLEKSSRMESPQHAIRVMWERKDAGITNVPFSRSYVATDAQDLPIEHTVPGVKELQTIFRDLLMSAPRKKKDPVRLKVNLGLCGVEPNNDEVKIVWPNNTYLGKLRAAQEKDKAKRKKVTGGQAIAAFERYRRTYVASLRNEIARDVHDYSEKTLSIGRIFKGQFQDATPEGAPISNANARKPHDLDRLLDGTKQKVLVIAGKAGTGKTTALRYLAWRTCTTHNNPCEDPLPVYLDCNSSLLTQLVDNLSDPNGEGLDEMAALDIVGRYKCMFFVDGFDDLAEDLRRHPTELNRLIKRARRSRFVISTRDTVIPRMPQQTIIAPLKPGNPIACLSSHGIRQASANRTIRKLQEMGATEILSTPMFLWFVALLLHQALEEGRKADIPSVPGALMKKVVDEYFVPEMLKKPAVIREGFSQRVAADDIVDSLAVLAYRMIDKNNGKGFNRRQTIRAYCKYFKDEDCDGLGDDSAGSLARRMFRATEYGSFLENTPDGTYKFWHNIFRDYLAACHIEKHWGDKQTGCTARQLMERFVWDEPVRLLCGFVSQKIQEECVTTAVKDVNISLGISLFRNSSDVDKEGRVCDYILNQLAALCSDGNENASMAASWLSKMQSRKAASALFPLIKPAIDSARELAAWFVNAKVNYVESILRSANRISVEYPERESIAIKEKHFVIIKGLLQAESAHDPALRWPSRAPVSHVERTHGDTAFGGRPVNESHFYGYVADKDVLDRAITILMRTICRWKNLVAKLPTRQGCSARFSNASYERPRHSDIAYVEDSQSHAEISALLARATDSLKAHSISGIEKTMNELEWIIPRIVSELAETEIRNTLHELIQCGNACSTKMAKVWMVSGVLRVQEVCKRRFIGTVPPVFDMEAVDRCIL